MLEASKQPLSNVVIDESESKAINKRMLMVSEEENDHEYIDPNKLAIELAQIDQIER